MFNEKCLGCEFCGVDNCLKGNSETCVCSSPLSWVGGKFCLADKLISMFPEHTTYVEPFGGAAHVLFKKKPSKVEIYNDIDDRLVNFFEVIKDKDLMDELCKRIDNTLYSRSIFDKCKNLTEACGIDAAYAFAILNKMSFGAKMGTWGVSIATNSQVKRWRSMPDKIQKAFIRMKDVQIENKDFEYILSRYDRPETFFYLDPPYCFSGARGKDNVYRHEMSNDKHERLIDCLLQIKGKAMLSGYDTPIYDRLGWNRIEVGASNMCINLRKGEKRVRKMEYVWVNY